ncbi:hypothetical protein AVEN_261176-1 [Araneus ventricosus]|uniref:Uncharacterized protein n=1 Tax=Araneus ventricosus TaxID=182803 RepID=A0A4Y2JGQ1_ARAVE|nr:hypothetical protein AVEN_261176-1 [Araneus ventricosus]
MSRGKRHCCHWVMNRSSPAVVYKLLFSSSDVIRQYGAPGSIFTNPTLIEPRQEMGQYDWLASPRADDVILCSRTEIITKQAIECGL